MAVSGDKTQKENEPNVGNFLGGGLEKWSFRHYYEVYMTDEDGRRHNSHGVTSSEALARAYGESQPSPHYFKVRDVFVVTNGQVAFFVGENVPLLDEGSAKELVKAKVFGDVSRAQREVLGFK